MMRLEKAVRCTEGKKGTFVRGGVLGGEGCP